MSELNLYQRINEIRRKVSYVKKDKAVSTGGEGSYKAVTHDQVCSITREHLVEHGVVCFPYLVSSKSIPPIQVEGQQKVNKQWRYEVIYDFKFINIDKPSEFEVVRVEGHGLDSGDKAPGKALSMCRKYASLKLFEIASGDEEENRYADRESFDLEMHLELLNNCKDVKELESQYFESKKLATEAKDTNAITQINRTTKSIKEALIQKETK
jgi:hypothetical protein